MKKNLAIMIAFMMVVCFSFAACGGSSSQDLSDSKYVGSWVATSMSVAGENQEDINGGDVRLILEADGTGTFEATEEDGTEEVSKITWELTDDGFRTKGDTKLKFKDDGDGIKANIMGVDLHFVKESLEGAVGPDDGAPDFGTKYGYMGQDPVECAVWEYLADDVADQYYGADDDEIVSVPVVQIIKKEEGSNGDYYIAGDYWIYNYKVEGDTLVFVSGGAHPGKMHVVKDDDNDNDNDNEYEVSEFTPVKDGGEYEPSAKEIFGDAYDKFAEISSNSDAREELRLKGLADYVKTNGLSVTRLKDGDTTTDLAL